MASHRRAARPGTARISGLTAAAAAIALTAPGSAFAAGPGRPQPTRPRPAAADAAARLDALYNAAESAGQRYDGALVREQRLERRADALQQRIAVEQQRLDGAMESAASLAEAQYRQDSLPTLRLLLAGTPTEYLDRAAVLDRADLRAAQEVARIRDERCGLARDRAEAEAELRRIAQLRSAAAAAKSQAQHRLAAARALLATFGAAQRAGLRAAEDQAARSAAAAGRGLLDGLLDGAPPDGQAPADARAAIALAAAERAVGMPYVYGAAGPSSFDCSGLMYWAWRQAGVTLPRTSQGQASAGTRIPFDRARPGDLVIYYGDMHHVGMYVGGGTIIHAPHPGATVRYERATDMPIAAVVRV